MTNQITPTDNLVLLKSGYVAPEEEAKRRYWDRKRVTHWEKLARILAWNPTASYQSPGVGCFRSDPISAVDLVETFQHWGNGLLGEDSALESMWQSYLSTFPAHPQSALTCRGEGV